MVNPNLIKFIVLNYLGFLLVIPYSSGLEVKNANTFDDYKIPKLDDSNARARRELHTTDENANKLMESVSINATSEVKLLREKRHGRGFRITKIDPIAQKEYYAYYDKASSVILGIFYGVVLDTENVKATLSRPIGLPIVIFCKFMLAPLLSYGFGLIVFPDNIQNQLELLLIGISLMDLLEVSWTIIIRGNVNLSIVVSVVNAILYLGLYPLWVMVGQLILNNVQDEVIVEIDVSYAITPLCIIISFFTGLCIKYAFPICKKYASSAVVEVSSFHFLIFLAISLVCVDFRKLAYPGKSMEYTNFLIAGTILSIIGCCSGWLMALIFRMDYVDRLAIATESITQNKVPFCTLIPMVGQLAVIRFCTGSYETVKD